MVKTFEEKCHERLNRLVNQAIRANSTYCMLMQIIELLNKRNYATSLSVVFFNTIAYNFIKVLFIEISKMFDESEKSEGIRSLLIKMNKNKRQLSDHGEIEYNIFDKLTAKKSNSQKYISIDELITGSLLKISENIDLINRVKKQRDKFYAHIDSKTNIEKLSKKYPVTYSDIEKLLLLNINICNALCMYFENKTTVPIISNYDDLKKTLYYVEKGIYVENNESEFDYSEGKPYSYKKF